MKDNGVDEKGLSLLEVRLKQRADVWHRERVSGLGDQGGSSSGVKGAADGATVDGGIGVVGGIGITSIGAAKGPSEGRGWSADCGTLEATYRRLRLRLDV